MAALAVFLLATSSLAAEADLPTEKLQRRKVLAKDGAALALYRYVPAGGGAQHPAILLVPDLGYAREIYDFQGCGLARHLQAKGRDTFVVELRGQGRSSAPASWSLRDWVEKDLPAAIAAVQSAHKGPVDVVVQGYGGSLVLAASVRELKGQIGRVVAFNTPAIIEVPNDLVRQTLKSGGAFSQLSKRDYEILFTHDGLFAEGTSAEFRGVGIEDLSPVSAAELLGWMEKGSFAFSDGSTFEARIQQFDRPTLLLLPLLDNFSHPEHASALRDLAKAAKVRAQQVSKFDLLSEDYTHLSSLLGKNVEAELFEPISLFLNATEEPK